MHKGILRFGIIVLLVSLIFLFRLSPIMGEWYAMNIYPPLSAVLTSFSSLFPFSLFDIFIFLAVAGLLIYPLVGWHRKMSWKIVLLNMVEFLAWVYIWFYFSWGLNYFREDFYSRTNIAQVSYSPDRFHSFLDEYVENLNNAYLPVKWVEKHQVASEVMAGYQDIHIRFGMCEPKAWQRSKTMLFSTFISKVGVTGYMGPFFCEFNLNADLTASQYPTTYAHEMAHLLGISSEAEANLYAYLVCISSADPHIRFSGYFSLFRHVLGNAVFILPEGEYQELLNRINPEIIQLYKENRDYWGEKYSPLIGGIQEVVYNWFLKGNKIKTGTANYSEVIGLLLSWDSFDQP